MRNLKKVLSLALAMVMLLGMMVVGAGAATSFKDDSDIPENREVAVAVANAIEVLLGDENGNFNPDNTLTRAEAAVVLTKLDLGADAAKALVPTDAASFDDVGTGYGWAKAYIDYCAGNGYMVGVGGNRFAPAQTLTSVEFGLMISRVLGYRDANEGITGDAWMVKAAAVARKAGLGTDLAVGNSPMTRADMAQMVLNALTAPMVEYTGPNISGDGFNFSSPATTRKHANDQGNLTSDYKGDAIVPNITPIRLCEEKFPTLKLDRSGENDFKEAYSVWKYKGVEISESKVALSYISTTQKETNNAWMTNVKNPLATNFIAYLNGEEITTVKTVSDITALTGNGRLVEVYVDPDDLSSVEKVVVIDTVPAEVTKVDSEGKLTVKLLATDSEVIDKDGAIVSADAKRNDLLNTNDKTVIDGEFKKGDLVLVNAYGKKQICKDSTVATVFAPEKREEFVIRKNYKDGKAVSVDTGDTTDIKDARNVITEFNIDAFSVNNKNKDSVLYLDKYGYIVKIVDWVDTTPQDGLIAIADIYQDVEDRKIVDRVAGVIANGETIELVYDKNKSTPVVGKIFTYNELTNGVYELDPVDADQATPVSSLGGAEKYVANVWTTAQDLTFRSNDTKGNANTFASRNFYSDSVKFIFADEVNKDVTVLKGRQAYSEELKVVAHTLDKKGEIIAVFLEAEPDFVSLDDIIFVWEKKSKDEVVGTDDQTIYYGYTAFNSDGSEIDDFFGTANNMDNAPDGKFYKKDTVKDGDIVAYKPTGSTNEKVLAHTITSSMITYANGTRGDSFIIGGGTDKEIELLTNSKTVVVDLATDRTITTPAELNQTMNRERKAVKVAVVYTYDKDAKTYDVSTIFVTEVGDTGSFDKVEVKPGDGPAPGDDTYEVIVKLDANSIVMNGDKAVADGEKISVKKGETLILTITAKEGYTVNVTGATKGTGDTYTVSAAGTVTVTSTEKVANEGTFEILGNGTDNKQNKVTVNYRVTPAGNDTVVRFWITDTNWPEFLPKDAKIKGNAHIEIDGAATRNINGDGTDAVTTTIDLGKGEAGAKSVMMSSFKFDTNVMTIANGNKAGTNANDFKPDKVSVRFLSGDAAEIDKYLVKGTDTTAELATTGTPDIGFALSTSDTLTTSNVQFTLTGTTTETTTKTNTNAVTSPKCTKLLATGVPAVGNDWVTVTLYGLGDLKNSYTVANSGKFEVKDDGTTAISASPAKYIELTAAPASVDAGGSVNISAAMTNTDTGIGGWYITVKLGDKTICNKMAISTTDGDAGAFAATKIGTINDITANIDLSDAVVTVEKIDKLAIKSVEVKANTITLTFNRDLDKAGCKGLTAATEIANATAGGACTGIEVVGTNQIRITYTSSLKAGDKVTIVKGTAAGDTTVIKGVDTENDVIQNEDSSGANLDIYTVTADDIK